MHDDLDLTEWRELGATITDDDRERLRPPADLWDRIEAAVASDPSSASGGTSDLDGAVDVPEPAAVIDLDQARTSMAPQTRRRYRRRLVVASAAASVVAVFAFSALRDADRTTTHVAQATNSGLPETYDGSATATAVLAGNQARLELSFDAPLPEGEPLEVWLIAADFSDMRSLGLVGDDHEFAIPADIDVADFPVVDVSVEPADGDPTHSGRSILRGTLVST